jgi:signal transduction histidine kinase
VEQDNELFDVLTESIALRLRSQQQAPLQPEVSLQHTLRLLSLLDEYGSLLRRMRNDPNEDRWDDYVDILKDAAYYDLETNLMNENWPSVETILRRPRQLGTIFDEYDMYRLVKLPRISNNSLERVVQLYHRFQPKYKMSLEIPANLSYHDRNDPQNEIWALTDLYNNNLGVWNTRETQGIREYAWALGSHELLDQMKRLLADISAEKPDFPMLIDEYIKFLPSARSAEEIERVKNELLSFANSLSGEQVSDNVQTTNRDGAPSLRDRSDRQAARTERAQARNPY